MSLQLIPLSVQSIGVIGLSSADAELQSAPFYPVPPEFERKCASIGVTIRINTIQMEAKRCVFFSEQKFCTLRSCVLDQVASRDILH